MKLSFIPRVSLICLTLFSSFSWAQEAQKQETAPTPAQQERSLVYKPEAPPSPEVFTPSAAAQRFNFGKVDLELLRQVNAFDKYIEEKGWIYSDPAVTGYVNRIGRSVVPPSAPENVEWKFFVVRDPTPNAFALPNGSIYIHSGLLSRLENEAQLAGVLAHESTHVFNRHVYTGYHDMRKKIVAIEVIQAGATAAGLAGASVGIVNAIGNLIPLALAESVFGYRRELEHESDVYAVRVMKNAGYDPIEMSKALEMLKKGPEVDLSDENLFWSDHPKLTDRVVDTKQIAEQIGRPEGGGRVGAEDFIASIKSGIRHDAGLAMMLGKPRTAVDIAKRLLVLEPHNAENYVLLGDAYRALGARTAVPEDDETTKDGKKRTRKMLSKLTQEEYEKALMDAPGGKDKWEANLREAESAYAKAFELDAQNPAAYRGQAFLYEQQGKPTEAIADFQKYLELTSAPKDIRQIKAHIESLQKRLVSPPSAATTTTTGVGK
ncbi:MAG TPA: M48 family metalloprotease [Terriglobales bacterium]|nr:M48 family metalloprotease [Terriglobales bacterium]